MIQDISFTSDYKVSLKIKNSKKQTDKKQIEKELNYLRFQQCCDTLANGVDGIMLSNEEYSDDKGSKSLTILHVPDEADDVIESYLLYNNIKFKKHKSK